MPHLALWHTTHLDLIMLHLRRLLSRVSSHHAFSVASSRFVLSHYSPIRGFSTSPPIPAASAPKKPAFSIQLNDISMLLRVKAKLENAKRELNKLNEGITFAEIAVLDAEGKRLGTLKRHEALQMAKKANLDLILISAAAKPPLCRIMSYKKYVYDLEKAKKQKMKDSGALVMKKPKGMRFSDRISKGDIETKVRQIKRFLEQHHPVSLACRKKKARSLAERAADKAAEGHEEIFKLISDALGSLCQIGTVVESGNTAHVVFSPNLNALKKKQNEEKQKEKQKEGKTDAKPAKANDTPAPAVIDADEVEIEENEFIAAFTATGASAGAYDAKQADEQFKSLSSELEKLEATIEVTEAKLVKDAEEKLKAGHDLAPSERAALRERRLAEQDLDADADEAVPEAPAVVAGKVIKKGKAQRWKPAAGSAGRKETDESSAVDDIDEQEDDEEEQHTK